MPTPHNLLVLSLLPNGEQGCVSVTAGRHPFTIELTVQSVDKTGEVRSITAILDAATCSALGGSLLTGSALIQLCQQAKADEEAEAAEKEDDDGGDWEDDEDDEDDDDSNDNNESEKH